MQEPSKTRWVLRSAVLSVAGAILAGSSAHAQVFQTDASVAGTSFNPGVRGQAIPAIATTRGDWPTGINGALAVSKGSSLRGVAGGLEADLYDWRNSNNSPREGTLNYLRYSRDYNADLYITTNIRGLVQPDPANPGFQMFYDTSISTLSSLAADWVRYTNHIVQTYRQGQTISDPRDQAIMNSLVWTNASGGSFDKLLATTEAAVPKVKYWEIGNEPRVGLSGAYKVDNSYTFLAPPRSADSTHKTDYRERYAAMASAMKAEDPTIKVGPAMQWLSSVTEQELLTSIAQRQPDGSFLPLDFIGYHPYQKLEDQTTPAAKEAYLRGVYDDHLSKINGIRNILSAAGRDPNSVPLVASEQNVSDWPANETPNEANMAHALGCIETDFSFARLGLQGAHYWIWPTHAWDGTQYPSDLAFQKLQDHMGDSILGVSASNTDSLHQYTTRNSANGEIAMWSLNFSDATAITRSTPITNVGGRGKVTLYTLGAITGTTSLSSSNLASDMTGGPTHTVDWKTTDMTGQRLDTLNLTYGSATISLLVIDKWRQMSLPGDVNADGSVNSLDTAIITANNNASEKNWWQGDVNGDGLVNSADAAIVSANQGLAVGNNRWTKEAGSWNTASNWASGSSPNAVGASAYLAGSITADRDITLGTTVTLGQLVFDNARSYNLTASSTTLKFQASGSNLAKVFVVQGTQKLGVATSIVSSTNIDVAGGAALQFNKPVTISTGKTLTQSGAGVVNYNDTVTVGAGGQISVGAGATSVFNKQVSGTNVFVGPGIKIFQAGASTLGAINTTGSTIVETGAQVTATNIRENALTVRGSVKIAVAGNDTATSKLNVLSIGSAGSMDLANNKLIVDYSGATALPSIRDYVKAGRGGTGFGSATWNGAGGIVSSSMAGGDAFSFALGYVDNSRLPMLGVSSFTSFGGQTVDNTSVLVRYTRGADATLDGKVNSDDVTIVGLNYNSSGTGDWFMGDFDFDGMCDSDDVTALGLLYDPNAPPLSQAQFTAQYGSDFASAFEAGRALAASGSGSVPEPAPLAAPLLALAALSFRKFGRAGLRKRASPMKVT